MNIIHSIKTFHLKPSLYSPHAQGFKRSDRFFLFLEFTTCSLFYAKHATDDKTIHFFVISLDYTFSDNKERSLSNFVLPRKEPSVGKNNSCISERETGRRNNDEYGNLYSIKMDFYARTCFPLTQLHLENTIDRV